MSDDPAPRAGAEVPVPAVADRSGPAVTGCLGEGDLALLRSAPPGGAPEHISRHLATCERCQERVLLSSLVRPSARAVRRPYSRERSLVLVVAVLVVLALFLYSVMKLAGFGR